jgi:hypothetical protein
MRKKVFVAAILMMIFVLINSDVNYADAAAQYKDLTPLQNISADHEFSIRLTQELDETSLLDGTVRIYEKATLKEFAIDVRRDTYNAKLINVKGKTNFEVGKTYTLEVRNLKSKKNKSFTLAYRVDFTIKSIYAGLPAEEGLIIIGNKAYAIDYITKNVWMRNEIIASNYDVYYIYDANYQKIKSLFNVGNADTSSITRAEGDKIYYTDPNGIKHLYVWRKDRGEFQLAEPKVNVDVIVRSEAKAVSINVRKVDESIPDARYYSVKNSNVIKELKDITDTSVADPIIYITSNTAEEISILGADKSVIAQGIVSIDKNYSGIVDLTMAEKLSLGNSAANINNNGIAVGNTDGYIYYVNSADKEKLYKQSIGGGYNKLILEDKAQYVNESGDWIYYSNYTDGGALYRIKKDGTSKEKLLYDKAAYITLAGQDIYYSNHSDGGKLYRVKKDMSDAKKGADGYLHGNIVSTSYGDNSGKGIDEVAYINVVGNWIYYSNYNDGHKPYVMSKDGTYRGKLSENYADCLQVEGDWIYFTSDGGTISKINKNENSLTIPIKATASLYNKGYHINVSGDWIFYSNSEDKGKLYKINTDGSGTKVKLADETVGYINIIGDWIYFNTTGGKSYRLPITADGTQKPELLGLTDQTVKISEIQDVYVTVDYADVDQSVAWLEDKYIPDKVSATMSDNTMQQLVVAWDTNPKNVVVKDGVRTYNGSVLGYNKTIKLIMTIPSQMLNDTNTITVYKNGNKNDMVVVEGDNTDTTKIRIAEGDVITVFDKNQLLLGTATVGKDGKATVSKLTLNDVGDSFFIKVKRGTKAPSQSTEVRLHSVPTIKNIDVADSDLVGVGVDSRDISVNKWTQAYFDTYKKNDLDNTYRPLEILASGTQSVTLTDLKGISKTINIDGDKVKKGQKIYVVPSKTAFDMTTLSYLDLLKFSASGTNITSWQGSALKNSDGTYYSKDSKGTVLKAGVYDVYVTNSYIGLAAPDVSNKQPVVYEETANSLAASLTMTAEGIPLKPTIKVQRVQGSNRGGTNDKVTLDKAPLQGETAMLVPVSIIDKYGLRGWRADLGTDPFAAMKAANEDVVYKKYDEVGLTMSAPKGQSDKEMEYKLFIFNSIGMSPESDNTIIVDNKNPDVKPVADVTNGTLYYVGDQINVTSDEKSKVYIVASNVLNYTLTPSALEAAVKDKNAVSVSHSGSGIKVPITKTETLLDFINPITTNVELAYYVVGVDEAGNISKEIQITIKKDIEKLYQLYVSDGLTQPNPSTDFLATLAKCKAVLEKTSVKQSEIDAAYRELLEKLNRINSELTLSSSDSKVTFSGSIINVYQMSISKLDSILSTGAGIQPTYTNTSGDINGDGVADGDGLPITDFSTLTLNGMKITVTNGKQTLQYTVNVYSAINISSTEEFLTAVNKNITVSTISVTSTPVTIVVNEDLKIKRPLIIQGSTTGNTILQFTSSGKITTTSTDLNISRINFTGTSSGIADNVIDSKSGALTLDNCKFTGFKFTADDKALVSSASDAKLVLTNSTFTAISSDTAKTFAYVDINSNALYGTKVENNYFYGTIAGKNVKGVMIAGNNIGSQLQINKNTFSGFVSNSTASMAMPIYVNGGSISMTGNKISSSESGIFIDASKVTQIDTISISNSSSSNIYVDAGKLIASKNSAITNNYLGDIMIGLLEDNKIPTIYYNSTTTPTIGNMTVDAVNATDATLTIGVGAGETYWYKETANLMQIAPLTKGTVVTATEYPNTYTTPVTVTRGKYITVIQVDTSVSSSIKVLKYRQVYIP